MNSSKAYWYIPNHVIFVHNIGDLTVDHFKSVDSEIINLLREAQDNGIKKTNIIVDCTEMKKLPNLLELEGGRILKYMAEENCGWTMIVGFSSNPFLVVLSRLLTTVMSRKLYLSHTLLSAVGQTTILEPHLGDLPDLDEWKAKVISRVETD